MPKIRELLYLFFQDRTLCSLAKYEVCRAHLKGQTDDSLVCSRLFAIEMKSLNIFAFTAGF